MTELAREYGEGLYDLAVEEKLEEELLAQSRMLCGVFAEQPGFAKLLSSRALSKNERLEVIDQTLKGQVHPYLLNFLKLLCERSAAEEFAGCAAVFEEHYNLDHNIATAIVTTGAPLNADQRARLIERLEAMSGHGVKLVEKIDGSLMGGVMLEMDGKRYDNSIKGRLENIRRMLVTQ